MKLFILLLTLLATINSQAKTLEIYFDTPELFLLKNNSSIKYQAVEYTSKKNKVKYRENIIYTYDTNKTKTFPVKHYNSVKSIEEKHPLLALIKRKDREMFIKSLQDNGINYPMKLKYILKTTDSDTSYKQLFKKQIKEDNLFSVKFEYPYLVNLSYAMMMAIVGLSLIFLLFRRRLF
ncbi:MAG: hypothetical protein U9P72_07870 [Campylobacterota bacterium]|nr:hypothetical protein [Campylobacterota bacterium]